MRGEVPCRDKKNPIYLHCIVMSERHRENAQTEQPIENGTQLNLSGYEIVRAQFFSTLSNPAMTISNGKMRFNSACLKKFGEQEYVELLPKLQMEEYNVLSDSRNRIP